MVLFMNRPTKRSGSSMALFRKRVPGAVLEVARGKPIAFTLSADAPRTKPLVVSATIAPEVKFSLRTSDPSLAKLRNAEATSQFEIICAAHLNGPRELDQLEVTALAGIAYRAFANGLERIATGPALWARMQEENSYAVAGPVIPLVAHTLDEGQRLARLGMLERRFGGFVDAVLTRERLVVDEPSRTALLWAFARAIDESNANLMHKAEGDFSPDPIARRFPDWQGAATVVVHSNALTFDQLIESWQRARGPAPGSVAAFKAAVQKLTDHLGHDAPAKVTKADIRGWRDALRDAGMTRKTVNDNNLALVRTLFRHAVNEDMLPLDPSAGVRDERKEQAGERPLPYTDEEVAQLLELADRETTPYLRWIPWLLAFTGARVGEIAQLWGKHVREVDGIHVVSITPTEDGGRLKNVGSERDVPLHPAILDRDFMAFVATRQGGPLFYGGPNALQRPRKPGAKRHASKGVANRVGTWVRRNGFDNPRKSPNHALRHWFKSVCPEFGIFDSQANALQGHAGSDGEADRYRHRRLKALHAAICKIVPPTKSPRESGGGQ